MPQTLVGLFIALAFSSATSSIISTQFHAQDGHGGYSYGHSGGPSSKIEHGSADGTVSGSYSYVDGNGIVQTATYSADPVKGFNVHASNLPVAPYQPPAPVPAVISAPVYRPLGVPVIDTPEVAAAKADHLAAVEYQKHIIASHPSRRRRSIDYVSHHPYGFRYSASTVHHPVPVHPYPPASLHINDVPVPVTDTPEVAAAKIDHLAAIQHAKLILGVY